MILMEDLERFGLGESTSLLAGFTTSQWGTVINFKCLYDPDVREPYEIILINCSVVQWSIHSPEETSEDLLSITDIQIKNTKDNKKEFVMYSEVFELIVVCEDINVVRLM